MTCIAISGVLALWPARPGIIRMHRGYTGASEPAKPRDGRVGLTSTPLRNISAVHCFWVTGWTASKPTLRSGSCANQSPTWSHSEATNSCILPEFKSFCQIFSPTSTFDLGNLSATDETLSSQIGRRLQVTPTLEQKSVVQVTRCNKKASANDGVYISIPITSYFSTVKWKAGMALDRPVEKRINCYLRNSSRGKQMHVG